MAFPLCKREVHNGGMIDGSARVRTDGQSGEAQVAARTAAGVIHVYGAVASRATTDRDTGRARSGGFVELPGSRASYAARASLHGTSVAGRTLTVDEAQPRAPRRGPRQPHSSTAHHLPPPVTRDHRSPGGGCVRWGVDGGGETPLHAKEMRMPARPPRRKAPQERHAFGLTILSPSHSDVQRLQHDAALPSLHGHKVWPTSFVLLDYLHQRGMAPQARVLDLGCG